jgi:metal-responsive CopG/Arc/MetJ family transcriptional regulator
MNNKFSISVSLDREQIEHLDIISERTKISRSVLIREGVKSIIKIYKEQLDLPFPTRESIRNKSRNREK